MKLAALFADPRVQELCQRYAVKRLSLFGSALRDDFGPESDVDLLVEFHPEVPVGFLTLARMARELSQILGRPVDLVPRDGLKAAIREAVFREERVIYAA